MVSKVREVLKSLGHEADFAVSAADLDEVIAVNTMATEGVKVVDPQGSDEGCDYLIVEFRGEFFTYWWSEIVWADCGGGTLREAVDAILFNQRVRSVRG